MGVMADGCKEYIHPRRARRRGVHEASARPRRSDHQGQYPKVKKGNLGPKAIPKSLVPQAKHDIKR